MFVDNLYLRPFYLEVCYLLAVLRITQILPIAVTYNKSCWFLSNIYRTLIDFGGTDRLLIT